MSDDYQLSEQEVRNLTGAVRKTRQLEWFTARGIKADLGMDGKVKVLREATDRHMLPGGKRTPTRRGPNLDALKKAG